MRPRKRMISIAVWLVAGVVTNILGTWSISVYGQWHDGSGTHSTLPSNWQRTVSSTWPEPTSRYLIRQWWVDDDVATSNNAPGIMPVTGTVNQIDNYMMAQSFIGWPFRSMWCWQRYENHGTRTMTGLSATGAPTVSWSNQTGSIPEEHGKWSPPLAWNHDGCWLPLYPLWSGFFFNSALYALVLWTLLLGPRRVRSALRKRRGACLRCGYALDGLKTRPDTAIRKCPECGHEAQST